MYVGVHGTCMKEGMKVPSSALSSNASPVRSPPSSDSNSYLQCMYTVKNAWRRRGEEEKRRRGEEEKRLRDGETENQKNEKMMRSGAAAEGWGLGWGERQSERETETETEQEEREK
jgi:hypothetical protein